MPLQRTAVVLAAELCLLATLGCEVKTSVRVESGPSFSFDGSGRLVSFSVYGPKLGHKIATPLDAKSLLWSFESASGFPGALVVRMDLAYGKVPGGYVQTVPSHGTAASPRAGLVYYFEAETTGAPGVYGFFYMDKNEPVRINVPDLCASAFVEDVRPVKCGTKDPYVEPKDLGQFVRENRIR